mgnify:CR=1 FL=1
MHTTRKDRPAGGFADIRAELAELCAANPDFVPAHPAATNPVLRRPPRPEGRVWLEHGDAIATSEARDVLQPGGEIAR